MSWDKSSTGTLHPILFSPPELRQILSVYSEGVLSKHWKDYGFQTAPKDTLFAVIERAEGIGQAVLCGIKKEKAAKASQDPSYIVYDGEKPVHKGSSFLEALDHFRKLDPKASKTRRRNLKVIK
jgi:hypothetical protein